MTRWTTSCGTVIRLVLSVTTPASSVSASSTGSFG